MIIDGTLLPHASLPLSTILPSYSVLYETAYIGSCDYLVINTY